MAPHPDYRFTKLRGRHPKRIRRAFLNIEKHVFINFLSFTPAEFKKVACKLSFFRTFMKFFGPSRWDVQSFLPSMHASHRDFLSDYAEDVKRFFDEESAVIITNRDRKHAAVLICALFSRAKTEVDLFCRNLDGEFYNNKEVAKTILAAANRGVRIQILVQEKPQAEQLLNDLLKPGHSPTVEVRVCKPDSEASNADLNFAVVDEKAFRFESNRNRTEAYACANDPSVAKQLRTLFDSFLNSSDAYQPVDPVR